jgi:hypothetical protein
MEFPSPDDLRGLVIEYARFRAAHGEAIGTPELVQPTGEYFPDAFSLTPEGVGATLRRMLHYAPVSDGLDLELAFVEDEGSGGGGCGTGACGDGKGGGVAAPVGEALARGDGAYRVLVAVRDVPNAVMLTTSLARSVGGIVLGEAGEPAEGEGRGLLAEIAASACGFGLLLTSGACVYTKSCGGLRAHQSTFLPVGSHAVLLALFCHVHDVKPGAARAHLETTQTELFDEAVRWAGSNPALLEALSLHPESLVDGVFPLEQTKGFLSRLFGAKPAKALEPAAAPVSRRARTPEQERRLAEAKAMVDDALGAPGAR